MILLRLLSAGKTLVGVGDKQSAYRLKEENRLPKFGGKENPFRATTFPEVPASRAVTMVSEEPITAPATAPARVEVERQSVAAPVCRASAPRKPARSSARKHWESFSGWMKSAVKSAPKSDRAPEPLPAQGELKLDAVRVVRNDLSDGDMLVGPQTPAAEVVEETAAEAPEKLQASAGELSPAGSESTWSRVSARIFGSENTR